MNTPRAAIPRVNVLGVGVSAINMGMALNTIEAWIADRSPHYVCVTGVHGVMESQRDPVLKDIHNGAGLVTPDGMPLVWLSRLAGFDHVSRVYGPDLFLEVAARSLATGWRHFYYGGGPDVAALLKSRMTRRFPGLQVVGTCTPPFRPLTAEEEEALVRRIDASGADIVWVGLSTPKQERWMARFVGRLQAPVLIGVGAAFDFHAGLKKQAPLWMQRSGLEWAFRMATEPRRLAGRYLTNNPRFVLRVFVQRMGWRRYPGDW
ncbi:WecB/TagA/CpsF family glycosyltransferase [Azospirillum thermophilum]|uniref:Glycosyltransferase n=1 Tax=Azospirillum thermophilum TaxID=2202148 RepID=A0A2S2CVM9_9PROT|nr:WecB/TagA/CpsF family glycosyltransferase [Azospirillum thermophilum]AWK88562.1 glycosyltransferase [Azospirillum thermophilum]